MKYILRLLAFMLSLGVFTDQTSSTVKINLSQIADVKSLLDLGVNSEGYIINSKYWVKKISTAEISILEDNNFDYTIIDESAIVSSAGDFVSFLKGKIEAEVNDLGCRLDVHYSQSQKLSFLGIRILDLSGKQYKFSPGYNIPKGEYDYHWNTQQLSDGIYLVQLESMNNKPDNKTKEKIATFFIKQTLP